MKDRDFLTQLAVSLQPSLLSSLNEGGQAWFGSPAPPSSWFSRYLWHSQQKVDAPVLAADPEETSAAAWDVMTGAAQRAFAEEKQEPGQPQSIEEQPLESDEPGIIERFEKLIERVFHRQPPAPK